MKPLRSLLLGLFLGSAIIVPVNAQITVDGTTNTTLTPTDNGIRIDEGVRAGDNLFHSFSEFSVTNGSEAFFNNANDLVNIFSRVTGGNISSIDGLIRANGSANLFLVNPAGIIFGENASLDLGGSFLGSTALGIVFSDNVEFLATDSDNPPLLTINMPIGLNFGENPQPIEVQKSQLGGVPSLALIGGAVNLDGANINAANIHLGGLAASGTVEFSEDGGFSFPDSLVKTDISLKNGSFLGIFGTTGGAISVNANNLTHTEGSNAIVGTGNDINIQTDNNVLFDNSLIITQVSGDVAGDAGSIDIIAKGNITFDNNSLIISQVPTDAVGNAGQIDVQADSLTLNQSLWLTDTKGQGNAGSITINIANQMTIDEGSLILTQVGIGGRGDAGDIKIATGSLISNNSLIIADSSDLGSGGDINITADDAILLQGTPQGNEAIPEELRDRPSSSSRTLL